MLSPRLPGPGPNADLQARQVTRDRRGDSEVPAGSWLARRRFRFSRPAHSAALPLLRVCPGDSIRRSPGVKIAEKEA
jgi:hypothetical protein